MSTSAGVNWTSFSSYGIADLLIRSDILNQLVPGTLDPDEARVPAPGIGAADHHYLQGGPARHRGQDSRPSRRARRLRSSTVLSSHSTLLYPHARNHRDSPWHTAKARIADALAELTLLPGMAPPRRRAAHARGIRRWDDPATTATALGVENQYAGKCDAVLAINRDTSDLVVAPARITLDASDWRTPAGLELYVDFETVNNMADDFSRLPRIGGQPLIFQVGCGRWEDGAWRFDQWTVDRLLEADEAAMIDALVRCMDRLREERGLAWSDVRVVHWSPAESSNLASAYNSAQQRHPERGWPAIPWLDFLGLVVRKEPVAVRGAFGFGLKGIAKGMHAAGLIETTWGGGPTDGLGAMIGAWWCDAEAARIGGRMLDLELMAEIARYDEVDCRSMAEAVGWLRANR